MNPKDTCQLRDPIYGFIEVSEKELKIIDSRPFQRLRRIKQLATTYLVYHGAEHSRFGHSLGVMHLVTRAFDASILNYKNRTSEDLFDDKTKMLYRQILRLIALVHDLGHAPFSHGSENLFPEGLEHEDYTKKIICETEISDYITDIGKQFGDDAITPELLWMIYGDENPELKHEYIMSDYKFLKSFMDSDIDCDKMDYLLRDSHYCGVNYGSYDVDRLISSLDVHKNKKHNILQLALKSDGIHAFEEFVIARYFMFIQVYYHKTRRYLDKLLVESIGFALKEGKYPADVEDYLRLDDDIMIGLIESSAQSHKQSKDFVERKVMSCVYQTHVHNNSSADSVLYNKIKNELAKKEIITFRDSIKKTPSNIAAQIPTLKGDYRGAGQAIPILQPFSAMPINITEESILLKSLSTLIDIKRIYVDKKDAEKAKEIVRSYFDADEIEEGDE